MKTEHTITDHSTDLEEQYRTIRDHSVNICAPLSIEDYVVQPIVDVSPPKWHLGHTTWFFETFLLIPYFPEYQVFDSQYNYVFNSYYETVGARVIRTDRGNLSRPSVSDIYKYRSYVDDQMQLFFKKGLHKKQVVLTLLELGLNHEQQHQELLISDIKYILGHNPLFPPYKKDLVLLKSQPIINEMIAFPAGLYEIGFKGKGFCFDNELGRHQIYLQDFEIAKQLVSNREYLEFIADNGYQDFRHWHAEGWDWVKENNAHAPLYWHLIDNTWMYYTLSGLQKLDLDGTLNHINYYEAAAYATWKGMRLPTEAEWEIASDKLQWGTRWEWTGSAYLPYPGFKKEAGAIGEYNGKFMVNQMVLRGASEATSKGHSRKTYRNFFHTQLQWQFTGIRLAR